MMTKRCARFEPYRDAKGEYRWRLRAANGRVIADSGEGYKTAAGRDRAIERVRSAVPLATWWARPK